MYVPNYIEVTNTMRYFFNNKKLKSWQVSNLHPFSWSAFTAYVYQFRHKISFKLVCGSGRIRTCMTEVLVLQTSEPTNCSTPPYLYISKVFKRKFKNFCFFNKNLVIFLVDCQTTWNSWLATITRVFEEFTTASSAYPA